MFLVYFLFFSFQLILSFAQNYHCPIGVPVLYPMRNGTKSPIVCPSNRCLNPDQQCLPSVEFPGVKLCCEIGSCPGGDAALQACDPISFPCPTSFSCLNFRCCKVQCPDGDMPMGNCDASGLCSAGFSCFRGSCCRLPSMD